MNLVPHPDFSGNLVSEFNQALAQLKASVPDLSTACVATRDGFEIARLDTDNDQRKLAAMASSMHALGDAIAAEASLGACRNVIIEGSAGKAVMLTIPDAAANKVLIAAASSDTNLAMLLISSRTCCEQLATSSNTLAS
ncbi:MAG: roadblock/LC7 domain-containing protein [Gallionella sp.]